MDGQNKVCKENTRVGRSVYVDTLEMVSPA